MLMTCVKNDSCHYSFVILCNKLHTRSGKDGMDWGIAAKENENYLFVWEKAGGKKKYRRM
jgi:hypothetical protein